MEIDKDHRAALLRRIDGVPHVILRPVLLAVLTPLERLTGGSRSSLAAILVRFTAYGVVVIAGTQDDRGQCCQKVGPEMSPGSRWTSTGCNPDPSRSILSVARPAAEFELAMTTRDAGPVDLPLVSSLSPLMSDLGFGLES